MTEAKKQTLMCSIVKKTVREALLEEFSMLAPKQVERIADRICIKINNLYLEGIEPRGK